MKKKIIIFSLLFVSFHLLFLYIYKRLLYRNNHIVAAVEAYRAAEKPLKFLFVGDSHIERGVDIAQFDDACSIAYYGENNTMAYYKFKYCVEHGFPKPQYVVINCDVVSFVKGFNHFTPFKGYYYSLMSFADVREMSRDMPSVYYDYVKLRLFPYAEWQSVLKTSLKMKQDKIYAGDKEKAQHAAFFIQKESLLGKGKENLFYANSLYYLERMIDLCEKNNIKPVFVRFPLTSQLFDEIKYNVDSMALYSRPSEDIIRAHHLPILDYERLLENKGEYFYDCHHLNEAGRALFTPVLKKGLDSLTRIY